MDNPTNNATDNLSSVIAKVQKLLSLAKNNNNPNEMKAASAAADKLIQEYRITQAQLESEGKKADDPMCDKTIHAGGRRTNWRETVLNALTKHYGCVWYMTKRRQNNVFTGKQERFCNYTVVGRKSDTEIVDYMFSYIAGEIERLCKWHSGGRGVGYAKSWLEGAAIGVSTQFHELGEAMKKLSTSTAMVLLDQRVGDAKKHTEATFGAGFWDKGTSIPGARSRQDALYEGYTEGKKIQINKALPQSDNPKKNTEIG